MPSSSPSPPSFSSRSSLKSSTSKSHHPSGSLARDKDNKNKDKNKDRDNGKTDSTEKDTRRDGDDTMSIQSKSSSAFSTKTTSSTQSALDTLRLIAGSGVRRSKCRAEFLEELAKHPDRLTALDKDVAEKLSIITGKEGVIFFRKFIGDEPLESGAVSEKETERMKKCFGGPVVFAVCVVEAGRKVVDYYMTWRGKVKAKDLGGSERRENLLDDEFRRVRREIDKSYSRRGRSNEDRNDSYSHKSERSHKRHSSPLSRKRTSVPPNIIVSSPDKFVDAPSPITPTANRPSSANDSVISLPFLGAIRNVPLSNRLPLRITNPDRNSFAESPVTQKPTNTSLETLVETPESAENAPQDPERQASVDTLVQASDADQKLGVPKEKSRKRYAESVSSAGSRSSKSSRSKSHGHHKDGSRSRATSSSRKHREISRSKSERKDHDHGHSSSSRHKDRNADDDKHSSSRKHRHSSRRRDERSSKDDKPSRKSDRKSSRHKRPLSSDITVVMVDPDEVDRVSIQEATKQPQQASSSMAWHGLTLTRRATKPKPAAVKTPSPWSGPIARTSDGVRNIAPYSMESESDDDENWEDVPGAPKRVPVIPPQSSSSGNDSDGSYSSSPWISNASPALSGGHAPSESETQATYTQGAYTPSLQGIIPRGIPATPQASPYTYGSPSVNHQGLVSPPFVSIMNPPSSGAYTPGYIPAPSISVTSPANQSSNLPLNAGYIPGFVPTHVMPSVGSNMSTPLQGFHHALSGPTVLQSHCGNSPYLYSTPRSSLGSPYVPAWISPHSAASASLPGSLTPASARGVPLHAGSGGYVASARSTAPY